MNWLLVALMAWLGGSLLMLVALLRAKPHAPNFYDLIEDQR